MKIIIIILLVTLGLQGLSQNVGIGTTTPLSKLHVAGTIRSDTLIYIGPGVRSLFATPDGRIYDSLVLPSTLNWEITGNSNITPAHFLGTSNANDVIFKTTNIERARILSTGNFGIGTASPLEKLHINGNILANDGVYPQSSYNVGYSASTVISDIFQPWTDNGIKIYDGNSLSHLHVEAIGACLIQAYGIGGSPKSALENTAYSSLILQDKGGDVGIGTINPGNRLEIRSATPNTSGLRFTNLTAASPTVASNGKALSVDVNGDVVLMPSATDSWLLTGNAGTTPGTNFLGTTDAQDIVFKTNGIERMRLLSNGIFSNTNANIIGSDGQGWNAGAVSSIGWTLNNSGYAGLFYNQNSAPGADGLVVKVAGNTASNFVLDLSSGPQNVASPSILSALGNGQIGIGTNAPTASAIVQIVSTTQGVMFPSMTSVQRLAIAAPAAGLLVYDVTANILMSFNGTRWQEVGGDPIGSIEAFHKSMPGTPALPWGWVECNGQVIADAESPYNGQAVPLLNTNGKFLRGSTTSGTMQTEDVGTHTHTGSTSAAGGHNHGGSTGSVNSTNGRIIPWDDNFSSNQLDAGTTGALGNTTPPGGLPWNGLGTVGNMISTIDQLDHTHVINAEGNHTHVFTTNANAGTETRPTNMSVVWIIRIK